MEITHFTPGQLLLSGPPLASYRSAAPTGALAPYLDAYTRPGDLVIDLFCQGPSWVHAAVQAGRRALGLNVNRALLLAASLPLTCVERQQVEAAFTRLAEARKGAETLQAHIEGLYRTTCAACGATTIADVFIWERDRDAPVAKRYHCLACHDAGTAPLSEAPTDMTDRAAAAHFERRGLSYWLLLDRAAPSDAPHRDRIASLLDLYTPRNLSALSDLLLKSDGLMLTPPVRRILDALLLDTLDRATSLRPPDSPSLRPRRLRPPARYAEANVWRLLENALEAWLETPYTPIPLTPSLDALLNPDASAAASAHLAPLSTAQARRELPPGSAALVVVDPPRPDTVLWHLSALWCHWLWGSEAGAPLIPILSRRWLDKDWLWRGLRGALEMVAPLLRPNARLVCLFSDESPALLEALTLAAAGAGYNLVGWGTQPPGDVRLNWGVGTAPTPPPAEPDPLSRTVAERVAGASLNVLRVRGEPAAWPMLHAALHADLAQSSLLARVGTLPDDVAASLDAHETPIQPLSWLAEAIRSALDGAPLRQLTNQPTDQVLWWLDEPLESEAQPPLGDRVEMAVAEILRELLAVTETDLHLRVYARFPGPQTPDAHLIRLCLFSYGDEHAPGHWRLRAEDDLEARAAETDSVIEDLSSLGRRLGFQVTLGIPRAGEWAVRWLDETGHAPYAFAVRTTAILGDLLFNPPPFTPPPPTGETAREEGLGRGTEPRTTPCLALPGGRAILVGYKLRHDPRLRQRVKRNGWQFLKFRHLRHLVEEVAAKQLDRYAFQAALGLDPIVEQEEAQLSLW
jgi:hypothetical protein